MTIELGTSDVRLGFEGDKEKSREQIRSDIVAKLVELGIVNCPEEIVDRLVMIGEHSGFNIDSEMICEAFGNVLSALEAKNLAEAHLTPSQKRDGLLAAFLHDIGKSGPLLTGVECQLSVIKLFSVKNLNPAKHIYVEDALREFFLDDYEKMVDSLKQAGITPDMTMRQFWNKHSWWTHDILFKYYDVIPDRVNLIASSHHINIGENPCGIMEDEIPDESRVIGALEHYVDFLEERILMVIDKYQAALMRRSEATHESAMLYLKDVFQKYEKSPMTKSIIETIDELGKTNLLFPKTRDKYQRIQEA